LGAWDAWHWLSACHLGLGNSWTHVQGLAVALPSCLLDWGILSRYVVYAIFTRLVLGG